MIYSQVPENFAKMLEKSKFFDKVEIKIICALLELEMKGKIKSSAHEIAKNCGMNVTNAYKYLYNLAKFGIVECEEGKQKLFYLSRVNPFERIVSILNREYAERKAALKAAGDTYARVISPVKAMAASKTERIDSEEEFALKVAYLSDLSKEKICIISDTLPEDLVILDSWKRARERGIAMRWLANEMSEEHAKLAERLGFEVRYFDEIVYPFIMVCDEKNGIVIEERENERIRAVFFLNYRNDFQKNFEKWWENAGEVK